MAELLKGFIDSLKSTTYEFVAILLPGLLLAGVVGHVFATPSLPAIGWVLVGYALGTAIQGVGAFLFWRFSWIGGQREPAEWAEAEAVIEPYIQQRLPDAGQDNVSSRMLFDICLTQVGEKRVIYDKFVALRDTSRGLAVVTTPIVGLLAWHYRLQLDHGIGLISCLKWSATAGVMAVLIAAFVHRYRRFNLVSRQAVYGQYLASQMERGQP